MCSGGLEPSFVLKAFREGADGVLVCGCNLGDCHYTDGNYKTQRRMALLQKVLEQFGIEEPRVQLQWVCASCAEDFILAVDKITTEIKALGPLRANKIAEAEHAATQPGSICEAKTTHIPRLLTA
jgi:F420-non-reducing hydrogenase iron-sulfur subunit